jgi:WD40 repeat protein
MGKNVHVEFGATEDEVLVWTDFTACVKIWCLRTGRVVEIRDPKFPGKDGKGWGYRPADDTGSRSGRGRVLALLCRASGTDILLLLAPQTYKVLNRVELPTTDAAGLRWSRDGRWLAIWDAASAGYKLCIYTADGHLYRTIIREASEDASEWEVEGLGIKSLEWVPGHERLAVGGWDRRVRILSTRTFAPVLFLDHTTVIDVPSAPVYTEQVDSQGNRSFAVTQQPATPPKAALEKNENALLKQGISILGFNSEGTMCASRDDSTPCTVWIWDLRSLRPRTIIIMYAPVKALLWHPHDPNRLLIQTAHDEPIVYLYTASQRSQHSKSSSSANFSSTTQHPPAILSVSSHMSKPAVSTPSRWTACWLSTPTDKKPSFTLAHNQASVVVWPDGKDQILRFEHEDEDGGEEGSDDSLYDILTGRTPIPNLRDGVEEHELGDSIGTVQALDDTFRAQREAREEQEESNREHSFYEEGVLGDSGMSEMF